MSRKRERLQNIHRMRCEIIDLTMWYKVVYTCKGFGVGEKQLHLSQLLNLWILWKITNPYFRFFCCCCWQNTKKSQNRNFKWKLNITDKTTASVAVNPTDTNTSSQKVNLVLTKQRSRYQSGGGTITQVWIHQVNKWINTQTRQRMGWFVNKDIRFQSYPAQYFFNIYYCKHPMHF